MEAGTGVGQPQPIHRADYRLPSHLVDEVVLDVDLFEECAEVAARLQCRRNPAAEPTQNLELFAANLELLELRLDGELLDEDAWRWDRDTERLVIFKVPATFALETRVRIHPRNNKALEGLYSSRGIFCTQCEAEGFRRITPYPDRPDVLAVFTTTVRADRRRYPVLLANGNRVACGEGPKGRHWATWRDPFPKPCYLFALVAGDLACRQDTFVTADRREVALRIYSAEQHLAKTAHAMDSLKRAMRWDEEVFGRLYDLDTFMIVAVDDFNFGAMENKGLNIFNTAAILAHPDISTDATFRRVENVVAHEYFHNWSGNRVTCRDWFQLSLKEGFTVFRDSLFSADMGSPLCKRIEEVRFLKTFQFVEDAGPMAHPVRPESYLEIDNFYTATVYEKGSELIGMLHLLLGAGDFRRGSDLYFQRHDGQAATIEDFVVAMEEASGRDLGQFRLWYSQVGTPRLQVRGEYDSRAATYRLWVRQELAGEQPEPLHIPLALGLLDGQGQPMDVVQQGRSLGADALVEITGVEQEFVFENLHREPVPSLLRGFSAPVQLVFERSAEELAFLFAQDPDDFNRWDAGQTLATQLLLALVEDVRAGRALGLAPLLVQSIRGPLADPELDPAFAAAIFELPGELYLGELMAGASTGRTAATGMQVVAIHTARQFALGELAAALEEEWLAARERNATPGAYRLADSGKRALSNLALHYLSLLGDSHLESCARQFALAGNMTDRSAALVALVKAPHPAAAPLREEALDSFYRRCSGEPLAVDLWFAIQAGCPLPGAAARVRALCDHPAFDIANPNRVRALVGAFAMQNQVGFHAEDGEGYRLVADVVTELDGINPAVAARLAGTFGSLAKMPEAARRLMRTELEGIAGREGLSRGLFEVVSKCLAADGVSG